MAKNIFKTVRAALTVAVVAMLGSVATVQPAAADGIAADDINGAGVISTQNKRVIRGERYVPTIWVDPDGCEHWVMDDGVEGYMSPHTNRQGIPVCRRGNLCGVMNSDQFFATDSYRITRSGRDRLAEFFKSANATSYIIAGHTDSRASDAYNMRLSHNRANSVAKVARGVGARIADVRGYGERLPRATNGTRNGMAQNRRVEIICIR